MGNFFIDLINFIVKCIGGILSVIFSILPPSPFTIISNTPLKEYLPYINYFVPVNEIVNILQLWLVAVGGYYIYQVALRWIKAIE